ncbi:MAG: ABC transporter permease subunit/CPBP intramembrane protease [Planctomycetota bacterium]
MFRRYRRVWVVYKKELLETLRDRRTLMAMVVVPIILYPALMLILVEALRKETGRRQAERYQIVVPDEAHKQWLTGVLTRDEHERKAIETVRSTTSTTAADAGMDMAGGLRATLRAEQLDIAVAKKGESLWRLIQDQSYHVGLLIAPPPDAKRTDDDVNHVVQFIYRDTDPRSEFVHDRLNRIFGGESERIIRARVTKATGNAASLEPILANSLSTASPSQQYAKILAMLVPFLLVTMTITGAMYPAIDLTAGERERGTLETLAVSPVPVGQIVAGKFSVIVTIAMLSTALNLGSMSAMVYFSKLDRIVSSANMARQQESVAVEHWIEKGAGGQGGTFSQKDYLDRRRALEVEAKEKVGFLTKAAPIVLLAMVPFAVLAGAVMLAVCSFARTFKEAQNYMMPVMMGAIIPALVVSYMPTIRLEGLILVMPVANIVVLIRELFLGNANGSAMGICLLSTCFYAIAAVVVAAKLYGHEAVLFSDVGSYKSLLLRRFIRPQPRPWPALVLLTVAILFPAYFYWQSFLVDPSEGASRFRVVLGLSQVLLLAAPPLILSWYLKLDLRETFSLRAPRFVHLMGALLMAVSIVPVASMAGQWIAGLTPALRPSDELFEKQASLLTSGSLWTMLTAFALVPAVCEELLFRGFLMAGLRGRLSNRWVVVVVGLLFGVFHIYIEKIPIVSLLGMVLTLACLNSGSIFVSMIVHVANNGLGLMATKSVALQQFFGLSDSAEAMALDSRTLVFVGVFVVGLLLIALTPRTKEAAPPILAGPHHVSA